MAVVKRCFAVGLGRLGSALASSSSQPSASIRQHWLMARCSCSDPRLGAAFLLAGLPGVPCPGCGRQRQAQEQSWEATEVGLQSWTAGDGHKALTVWRCPHWLFFLIDIYFKLCISFIWDCSTTTLLL